MSNPISRDSVVAVTGQHVSSDFLDDEVVLLDVHKGTYYGFDPIGARVWKMIQTPTSVGEIVDALLAEYEVEGERCMADVSELLQDLLTHGLVEIRDDAP